MTSETPGPDQRTSMDSDTLSLAVFLRARYDEREQKAEAAAAEGPMWRSSDSGIYPSDDRRHPGAIVSGPYGYLFEEHGEHIADNDPQYVLDDLASKRVILDAHHDDGHGDCAGCGLDPIGLPMHQIDECPTLLALARPFTAHPDCQDAWKP
ncbi:DUF6221 family protein [Micromonospora sp. NPDC049801]|uniref:DUF6221 family protein n=1 Tax=unclassified Micromonospora TaxID=2617518 RepID=UPI0033F097D0